MQEMMKKYQARFGSFYTELTQPQRLSLLALVLTFVTAVVLMVSSGVTTDMEPLFFPNGFAQMDQEQLARIHQKLKEMKTPFETRGGIIYVPAAEKENIVAALYAEPGLLPDSDTVWDWIWEPDWTGTAERTRRKINIGVERRLTRMISSFHAIREAQVQIVPGEKNRMFKEENASRAAILVSLRGDQQLTKQEVIAISRMVSHSVQDLAATAVQISDTNGRHYKVPDMEEYGSMPIDQLEIKQKFDEYWVDLVRQALGPLGLVAYVTANIDLDFVRMEEKSHTVGPPGSPKESVATSSRRITENSKSTQSGPEQPGADTNTEKVLGSGIPTDTSDNRTEEETAFDWSHKDVIKQVPPGMILKKRIVVFLPHKQAIRSTSGEVPEDTAVQETNKQENIKRYEKALMTIADLKKNEVLVDVVPFPDPPALTGPGVGLVALQAIEEYGGNIFLGILALAALFGVSRVLKKSIPPRPEDMVALSEEVVDEGLEALMASRTPGRFDPKTQVLRDKIQEIVQDNPRGATAMLRQWIRKDN